MNRAAIHAMALALTLLALGGCDRLPLPGAPEPPAQAPAAPPPSTILVVDLGAVAKAMGEDAVFKQQMEQASTSLTQQLSQIAGDLTKQLEAEREKLSETPSDEERQNLARMTAQAQQELRRKQQEARLRGQQFQASLRQNFVQRVQPVAARIARERGAKAVQYTGSSLIWFDESVDITGEVIDVMRAQKQAEAVGTPGKESDPATGDASRGDGAQDEATLPSGG